MRRLRHGLGDLFRPADARRSRKRRLDLEIFRRQLETDCPNERGRLGMRGREINPEGSAKMSRRRTVLLNEGRSVLHFERAARNKKNRAENRSFTLFEDRDDHRISD